MIRRRLKVKRLKRTLEVLRRELFRGWIEWRRANRDLAPKAVLPLRVPTLEERRDIDAIEIQLSSVIRDATMLMASVDLGDLPKASVEVREVHARLTRLHHGLHTRFRAASIGARRNTK